MHAADTLIHERYRIVRQIGQGGMGAVYEAVDQHLGNRVALKQTLVAGALLDRAFEREAKLLASLHHPALPVVSDYFSDLGGQFLVMQFIPGDDLATLLRQRGRPFEVAEVLRWADQLLDALEYLHAQQPPVIHRDIKPQNIKLTPRGGVILLDFGLAKGEIPQQSQLNESHSLFGYTPQYAPLEQIQGSGTDGRSDLYALAATLYHLLAGAAPVDALTRLAATARAQPDPLPPLHTLRREVTAAVSAVILAALAIHPDQRPPGATVMRTALHHAAVQRAEPPPPPAIEPTIRVSPVQPGQALQVTTVPMRPATRRAWLVPLAASGVALLLTLIAALGLLVWRGVGARSDPTGEANAAAAVTPAGTPATPGPEGQIAFMSTRDGNQEIYSVNVDGTDLTRLTVEPADDLDPAWSPDGRQIAFVSNRDGYQAIYVMNADGTEQRRLTDRATAGFNPAWSPDGRHIAFISGRDSNLAVFIMAADGSDISRISGVDLNAGGPAWSPDGKQIVFVSSRDFTEGSFEIYVINSDGGGLRRLTENPAIDTDPDWSPDGSRIVFMSTRNGNPEIHVMNADGTDQKYLTLNGVTDTSPVWSPDGNWIAFVSQRDGKLGIYIMDADGLNERAIVTDARDNFAPSWAR